MALPSLPGRRRARRARRPRRAHHRLDARDAAPPDAFRDRAGQAGHLPGRGRRDGLASPRGRRSTWRRPCACCSGGRQISSTSGSMIAICGCFRQGTIWSSWRLRTAERSIFRICGGPSGRVRLRVPRRSRLARLCARCSASTWMWSQRGDVAESDRRLRPTALALRGMRPPRFPEIFEAFANVVPFQQLSLDAGVAIVSRLVERFGERLEHERTRLLRLSQGPGDRRGTDRGAAGVRPEPWEGPIHPIRSRG